MRALFFIVLILRTFGCDASGIIEELKHSPVSIYQLGVLKLKLYLENNTYNHIYLFKNEFPYRVGVDNTSLPKMTLSEAGGGLKVNMQMNPLVRYGTPDGMLSKEDAQVLATILLKRAKESFGAKYLADGGVELSGFPVGGFFYDADIASKNPDVDMYLSVAKSVCELTDFTLQFAGIRGGGYMMCRSGCLSQTVVCE